MVFRKERVRNWLIFLLIFICLITITDIGMRIFLKQPLRIWRGNERLRYRHDDNLGWRIFLTCWIVFTLHFAPDIVREHYPALALGDRLSFLQFHETYHAGQTGILRRLAGKKGAIA